MISQFRNSAIYLLPVVLLVVAGLSAHALRERRLLLLGGDAQHAGSAMKSDIAANDAAAPMLEFVNVALGGFRGLVADMLWLRAGRLQEERRFVELAQLSDWITKLEPRLAEVWVYHAWNMAYNISVLMQRPEDRWLWIQNGIELLRDSAIPLNPRDTTIQRELGWIFQHKLGADSDRHAAFYRSRWASDIGQYLDPDGAIPDDSEYAASELLERFRMEPALMREIEARFGRIDWRLPHAQSLYWAWRGLKTAPPSERLRCRRMIYVSLMEMALNKRGVLTGDPSREDYEFAARPNPTLILPTSVFVEETMRAHELNGIRNFYTNFLFQGMKFLALTGDEQSARLMHSKLAAFFAAAQLQFPPYEQALIAPDDFIPNLMRQAGYN